MFSKAKNKQNKENGETTTSGQETSGAFSSGNAASRRSSSMKAAGVPSIISADMSLRGDINSAGEVQLDGELEGNVHAKELIVGEMAAVHGEIMADHVIVRGKVDGGIRAKNVTLASSARILGDILHSYLSVESGAHFEGNCRHSDDPLSDTAINNFRTPRAPAPASRPVAEQTPVSDTGTKSEARGNKNKAAKEIASGDTPSFQTPSRSPLR